VVPVIAVHRVYATADAPYGRRELQLVAPRQVIRAVRVGRTISERVVAPTVVLLPIARGQRLGEVRVYAGKRVIAREPLVAARAISKPGFLGRVGWYARRTVHHVWSWIS
jgi:hypothetical protein